MNELQMIAAFAELEGIELMVVCEDAGGPVIRYESLNHGIYNPITNLALNCAARDKYKVTINYSENSVCTFDAFGYILTEVVFRSDSELNSAIIICILKDKGLL